MNVCKNKSLDCGPEPYVTDIAKDAKCNTNYRTAIWTGKYMQTTLMSIPVGSDVGLEIHNDTEQFFYVVSGEALVKMGKHKDELCYRKTACEGDGIFIPCGTWHNIINNGKTTLKLYSVYAPPHHPHGTVHKFKV